MIRRVVVTVPAADEQDEIGGCLLSLTGAVQRLHRTTDVRADVVVVLDDCHDGTAEVVAGFPDVAAVVSTARCVGSARRQGVAAGLAGSPAGEVWLASTDADCRVPDTWLVQMLDLARGGAALVLGTVRPSPGLHPGVEQAWHAAHLLHDGHPHIHAANLGIAAATYRAIGGWRDLSAHEDVDLVGRAVAAGVPIARSDAAPVVTSTRLDGRAPHGFAAYLQALHDDPPGGLPAVS